MNKISLNIIMTEIIVNQNIIFNSIFTYLEVEIEVKNSIFLFCRNTCDFLVTKKSLKGCFY